MLLAVGLLVDPARADFTIPNVGDAGDAKQAQVDKVDLDILVAGTRGDGVVSGAAVTAQGSPDMTVAVATGVAKIGTTICAITSGNVTITTADGTNPRFDLIVVNNSCTKSATAGTAAASPVFPAIPANSIVLAAVFVPANDTTIAASQIVDKRVIVIPPNPRLFLLGADFTTTSTTASEVTGIGPMTVFAAGNYELTCTLVVRTAATGTGIDFGVNYTGTVTQMVNTLNYPDNGATTTNGTADGTITGDGAEAIVAHSSTLTETTTAPNLNGITGVITANEDFWVRIRSLMTVSDTGDIELWSGSDVAASQVVIRSGSYCSVLTL